MNLERLVAGLLLGLAIFWVGASFWVRGDGVPDWWLVVALGAGLGGTQAMAAAPRAAAPAWARWSLLALLAIAFAAVAYGAVATPSRHWDGAASFDAKVFWFVQAPTLQQPFFATEGVFHHGPAYPLLPALSVAMTERLLPGCGRLMLALVYLLMCGTVAVSLRRRGVRPLLGVAVTAAFAVTPALLTSGGAAIDSGYNDPWLLLATTAIAAGLLNRVALWFSVGILLAVVCKPEGSFYAAVAIAVAFVRRDGALQRAGFAALATAMLTWAPVRAFMLHTEPGALLWFALPAAAAALWSLAALSNRFARPERVRLGVVLLAPIAALAILPWIAPMVTANSAFGVYMRQAGEAWSGLANLGPYCAGLFDHGFARLRLGLVFVLPLAIGVVLLRRRQRPTDGAVGLFVAFGLLATIPPFVLSPEPDIHHHIRSSLPRLLLHWVGPTWLLTAAWLEEHVLGRRDADA